MLNRHPSSIYVDAHHQLEKMLSPDTRARAVAKRARWLDGIVSPFAKEAHKKERRSRKDCQKLSSELE
jgi:hypothetical protein